MLRIAVSLLVVTAFAVALPTQAHAIGDSAVPQSVTVSGTTEALARTTTRQLTATARYADGTTQDVTASSTWASSNTTAATIDSAGVVSGLTHGITFITAEFAGVSSPATQLSVSRCTYIGTADADVFVGTPSADHICGLGGDDDLTGGGGADLIEGGAGDDTLIGSDGNDTMYGQADDDALFGDEDTDALSGGSGHDDIYGGTGFDRVYGDTGDDFLYGEEDDDQVYGGADADELYGEDGNDRLAPGAGDDVIVDGGDGSDSAAYSDVPGPVNVDLATAVMLATGAGTDDLVDVEHAIGSPADDTLQAGEAGSTLTGLAGVDTLLGSSGNDLLKGGSEGDSINGGEGADLAYGDGGVDTVNGDGGNDTLNGGDDGDSLGGGADNDTVKGDAGDDTLNGGTGTDKLVPGPGGNQLVDGDDGTDTVSYEQTPTPVEVDLVGLSAQHDRTIGGVNDVLEDVESVSGSQHADRLIGNAGVNTLNGFGGADEIVGGSEADRLNGGAGTDTLEGGVGNDKIYGDGDADTLRGEDGHDLIHGGAGDDVEIAGGDGIDILYGQAGSDTLSGGAADDALNPGLGDDTAVDGGAGAGDALLYTSEVSTITVDIDAGTATGGSGNDAFVGIESVAGTNGDDTLNGDENVNRMIGRGGIDTINGRGGADVIFGGTGNDLLRGGTGDVDQVDGQGDSDTCGEYSDTQVSCEAQFNVPPTLTVVGTSNSFTEGDAAKPIDPALTLTDDETHTESATVTISSGFESGKDVLTLTGPLPSGVTATFTGASMTISGPATVAEYESMLKSVRFENTSQDPSTTARTITFAAYDGEESDGSNDMTMSVVAVNDAPVADTDSFSGGQHGLRLRVGTAHADSHETETAGDVIAGDADVDTPVANLTAGPATITSAGCAAASPACSNNVTMAADGTFTYDPPQGQGATDTFTYTVSDNDTGDAGSPAKTHTETVTVNYSGTRAWFVDAGAPSGGRGVSHDPAQSLARLATGGNLDEEDGANDRILVYSGTYTNGIDLEAGQQLLGQPHGLNIGGTQFVSAGGTKPALSSASTHAVALHSGNEVQDLALGNTPAGFYSLSAPNGAGAFTVEDTDIVNGTGGALNVSDGTPTVSLGTLSSTGSTNNGLRIADTEGGTLSSDSGTLSNATGATFAMSNSNTNVTLGSAISDDLGQLVSVSGGSGDVTYNGTITDGEDGDGSGIAIASTSGDHNFTKSVLLSVDPATNAFSMSNSASGSLRMVPTSGVNRITSTTGTALNVTDTPIHADGIKFERINSQGLSKYGINLQNNGPVASSGRLEITGTGSAGSGGTITGKDDGTDAGTAAADTSPSAGIYLQNTRGPSLAWMNMSGFGDFAIKGQTVDGFNMANTVIGTSGNNSAPDEGAISFDELSGTGVSITNSSLTGWWENGLRVRNDSGSLNRLTVTNTTLGSTLTESTDAIQLDNLGSGSLNATIGGATAALANTFTGTEGDQFQTSIQGTGTGDIVFKNNTVSNNHSTPLGGGIVLGSSASGDMTYEVSNNTVTGAAGTAIVTTASFAGGVSDSTAVGTIANNVIGTSGVAGSGSTGGSGIDVSVIGNGRNSVQILNNTIRQTSQHGIIATAGGAARSTTLVDNTGDLNITATGNVADQPHNLGSSSSGFSLTAGTNSAGGADQYDVCLAFSNNDFASGGEEQSSNSRDYVLLQNFETKVHMPSWPGPQLSQDVAFAGALTSYLDGRDTGASTPTNLGRTNPTDYSGNSNDDGFFNTAGSGPCSMS